MFPIATEGGQYKKLSLCAADYIGLCVCVLTWGGPTSGQTSRDTLSLRDAQLGRRGLGHAHGAGRKGPYALPYHLGGCGVGGLRCLLSIACCRRGKSSRHESKRFPDKCRLAIATVAGPIAAPAAPKLRGLSAERVNRTTLMGTSLTLQMQKLPSIVTLLLSLVFTTHAVVFRHNHNSTFTDVICNSPISLEQIVKTLLLLSCWLWGLILSPASIPHHYIKCWAFIQHCGRPQLPHHFAIQDNSELGGVTETKGTTILTPQESRVDELCKCWNNAGACI